MAAGPLCAPPPSSERSASSLEPMYTSRKRGCKGIFNTNLIVAAEVAIIGVLILPHPILPSNPVSAVASLPSCPPSAIGCGHLAGQSAIASPRRPHVEDVLSPHAPDELGAHDDVCSMAAVGAL